jgi:FlaA1/EpsC-like NDP-sugar epimerase
VHEILLTKEESRHTIELGDYFVVLPENLSSATQKKGLEKFVKKGKRLKADFHFTSDGTTKKMSRKTLLQIVDRVEQNLHR